MAVCTYCNQEMTHNVGCTADTYGDFADGIVRSRLPMEHGDHVCHDCGVPPGTLHHPGCDVERCPKCGFQAISCDCAGESDQED